MLQVLVSKMRLIVIMLRILKFADDKSRNPGRLGVFFVLYYY